MPKTVSPETLTTALNEMLTREGAERSISDNLAYVINLLRSDPNVQQKLFKASKDDILEYERRAAVIIELLQNTNTVYAQAILAYISGAFNSIEAVADHYGLSRGKLIYRLARAAHPLMLYFVWGEKSRYKIVEWQDAQLEHEQKQAELDKIGELILPLRGDFLIDELADKLEQYFVQLAGLSSEDVDRIEPKYADYYYDLYTLFTTRMGDVIDRLASLEPDSNSKLFEFIRVIKRNFGSAAKKVAKYGEGQLSISLAIVSAYAHLQAHYPILLAEAVKGEES